jgi:hypothetical protein
MTDNGIVNNSICKSCRHRFRRVFIPLNPEEYFNEADGSTLTAEDNIIIYNQCLITDMDMDNDETIECSAYEKKEDSKKWVANISI